MRSSASQVTTKTIAEPPAVPARVLFWLTLSALAMSVATVIGMTEYSRSMERWVEHSTLVYQTTRSGLLDLTGPIPGGTRIIVDAAGSNPARAIARFDSVGDLTQDNPTQQARVRTIRELAGQWASAIRYGTPVAPGLAAAVESKVDEFLAEESRLYAARSTRFHRAQIATAATVTIELVFVALIVVAYSRRIAQFAVEANALQNQLEEQATELEAQALDLEVTNHELREAAAEVARARERDSA